MTTTNEDMLRDTVMGFATINTRQPVEAGETRLSGVVKVIFQTMRDPSLPRQEMLRTTRQHGYSDAEFNCALQCLEETAAEVGILAPPVALPASRTSPKTFDPAAAGKRLVADLQAAEGGAWTGSELQTRFGLTPAVLHRRRKEFRIAYWRDARHEFHYPQWQFTPTGALLPGMQATLQLLRSADEWRVMAYFLNPRRQLGDRRPLDLLRAGEQAQLLSHAQLHVEENTW